MEYLGTWGTLIHEKKWSRKSRVRLPLGHMYILEISMKRQIFWYPIQPNQRKKFTSRESSSLMPPPPHPVLFMLSGEMQSLCILYIGIENAH